MAKRRRERRGALLLVCLVLLVLFLLLGITFVLTATSWRKGSKYHLRALEYRDQSPELLDSVLMDFLRGSTNPRSPFRYMNLLDDLYGNPALRGRVGADAVYVGGGQFMRFSLGGDAGFQFSAVNGYYNGQVLTMLNGAAKGQSTRIVHFDGQSMMFVVAAFRATVGQDGRPGAAGVDDDGQNGVDDIGELGWQGSDDLPEAGDLALINGREFSGTGNGYKRGTTRTDADDFVSPKRQYALMPNPVFFEPTDESVTGDPTRNYYAPGGLGGGNEDYDAPDFNNPWLSVVLPGASQSEHIKPSFHDPKLIDYWIKRRNRESSIPTITNSAFKGLYRKISFRPVGGYSGSDHPNFTGSNSAYDAEQSPFTGPWDVDNDGDGVMDSIWMDVGLPVISLPDGRLVKPLVAPLIRDLDGRININVAGSLDMLAASYTQAVDGPYAGASGGTGSVTHPRGQGYGPAEINPMWALGPNGPADSSAQTYFRNLLVGSTTAGSANDETWPGRFGDTPGGPAGPGTVNASDLHNRIAETHAYGSPAVFGTPHNLRGLGAAAVDHRGHAFFPFMGNSALFVDDPYEQLLGARARALGIDAPFTPEEMEIVLRPMDVDSGSLPRRVLSLAPILASYRDLVTTDSWDIPVYGLPAPRYLRWKARDESIPIKHITDLFQAKVASVGGGVGVSALVDAGLIAPEVLAGLKFDLNRLFRNGIDDDGDGIIDNIEELQTGVETVYGNASTAGSIAGSVTTSSGSQPFSNIPFDANRDGMIDATDLRARQDYAKQLYCLLMLVADEQAQASLIGDNGLTVEERERLFARKMAQFAINAVDFRDQDAIMTPFEYDENPFNGWSADGNVLTPEGGEVQVVWGCEAPAALLTETIAFHNTRIDDADRDVDIDSMGMQQINEPDHNVTNTDANAKDLDYDSVAVPEGSLFLEVYCPASPYRLDPGADGLPGGGDDVSTAPLDLYTADGSVDLGRLTSGFTQGADGGWGVSGTDDDGDGTADNVSEAGWPNSDDTVIDSAVPVWRVAITVPHHDQPDSVVAKLQARPDSTTMQPEQLDLLNNDSIDVDRIVWFAQADPDVIESSNVMAVETGLLNATTKAGIFFNRSTATVHLPPGRYMVAGPREQTDINQVSVASARYRMSVNFDGVTFRAKDNTGAVETVYTKVGSDIQQPGAIICSARSPWTGQYQPKWVGMNVSEPPPSASTYYPAPADEPDAVEQPDFTGVGGHLINYRYTPPLNKPLDTVDPANPPATPTPIQELLSLQAFGGGEHAGTKLNYRTAFLQRLADPTRPYHPKANPYLTVDWMQIDLTVFNGDGPQFNPLSPPTTNPPPAGSVSNLKFGSRQRGTAQFNVWKSTVTTDSDPSGTVPAASKASKFSSAMKHSLGYLNSSFGASAYLTSTDVGNGSPFIGDPQTPFPWLVWNDRPYISQYELMQVPASPPALLAHQYGNAYTNANADVYEDFDKPYSHLLNFFHSNKIYGAAGQLGRVLDYLHVPSRYADSFTVLNPRDFAGINRKDASGNDDPLFDDKGQFRPPFNILSAYREPGKININTIYDRRIWWAIMGGESGASDPRRHPGPTWEQFVANRRGYAAGTGFDETAVLAPEFVDSSDPDGPYFPSYVGLPYRAGANYDYHPLIQTDSTLKDTDVTLLRPDITNPEADGTLKTPLFADSNVNSNYNNAARNSYFRYQPINRMANLLTTRSNVYAIWLTIGYFEVTTAPRAQNTNYVNTFVYPDGYQLGREVGEETGETKRHRAFYMVDRSVPVGYENGQDHNVKDAIRVRKFLE